MFYYVSYCTKKAPLQELAEFLKAEIKAGRKIYIVAAYSMDYTHCCQMLSLRPADTVYVSTALKLRGLLPETAVIIEFDQWYRDFSLPRLDNLLAIRDELNELRARYGGRE